MNTVGNYGELNPYIAVCHDFGYVLDLWHYDQTVSIKDVAIPAPGSEGMTIWKFHASDIHQMTVTTFTTELMARAELLTANYDFHC